MRLRVLCRYSHHFRTTPAKGAHIAIGDAVGFDNRHLCCIDLIVGHRNIEIHDHAGIAQAFSMLASLEDGAGIHTLTLEDEAGIVQTMAERMGFRVAPGQHLAIQPDRTVAIVKRDQCHCLFLLRCRRQTASFLP